MNVIVEIESAEAMEIARRFLACEPTGQKTWFLKNRGQFIGKCVKSELLGSTVDLAMHVDPHAVIHITGQETATKK